MSGVHPRVSVNPMTTIAMPLADACALWRSLGTTRVGLNAIQMQNTGWEAGIALAQEHHLDVVYLNYGVAAAVDDPEGWRNDADVLCRAIDAAAELDAQTVYFASGPPGECLYDEAVEQFGRRLAPVLAHAQAKGVRLSLEPCVSSRPELGFVHTVRDALLVAQQFDIGVCLDFYASWLEPHLVDVLRDNLDRIDLLQISDFVIGTLSQPNRWVPGDGDLPLGKLLDAVAASGYRGVIDLELLGPKINEEGAASVLQRGAAWLTRELDARGM